MKFTIGTWETRDGRKATITQIDNGDPHYPLIGYIQRERDDGTETTWDANGINLTDLPSKEDLIGPWEEPALDIKMSVRGYHGTYDSFEEWQKAEPSLTQFFPTEIPEKILRDLFAMFGPDLVIVGRASEESTLQQKAEFRYKFADAMLEARKK